jgi:hypothetical protein
MVKGTLWTALEGIEDRLTQKGRRFPLPCDHRHSAMRGAVGCERSDGDFRWGRRLSPKPLAALGIDRKRKKSPCHAPFHYVFQSIAADDLARALGTLVKLEAGLGHVAEGRDGLRPGRNQHILGAHTQRAPRIGKRWHEQDVHGDRVSACRRPMLPAGRRH